MAYYNDPTLDQDKDKQNITDSSNGSPFAGAGGNMGQGAAQQMQGQTLPSSFTNIQDYLSANPNDKSVNDAFGTITGDIGKERGNFGSFADSEMQKANDRPDIDKYSNALNKVAGLSTQYLNSQPWLNSSNGNDVNSSVSDLSSQLSQQVNPYQSQNPYTLSNNVQNYGNALMSGDQGQVSHMIGNVYSQKVGQPLSGGVLGLQNQLDVNNPDYASLTNDAITQYNSLKTDIQSQPQKIQDAATAASAKANQLRTQAQNDLGTFNTNKTNFENALNKPGYSAIGAAYQGPQNQDEYSLKQLLNMYSPNSQAPVMWGAPGHKVAMGTQADAYNRVFPQLGILEQQNGFSNPGIYGNQGGFANTRKILGG